MWRKTFENGRTGWKVTRSVMEPFLGSFSKPFLFVQNDEGSLEI
jgi:hypothetical protein